MPPPREFNLNIEVDILTAGAAAEIVNAVLEFLLYQRNQIPYVYKTYKHYVEKWSDDAAARSYSGTVAKQGPTLTALQLERQRGLARETKDAISAMRRLITTAFDKNTVRSLRFLFGATTFTAKEAYTIHIPDHAISRRHSHSHHRLSPAHINQMILSLLSNEELDNIFLRNLFPTNLYLELEIVEDATTVKELHVLSQFLPKGVYQLPQSCKDVHFHLLLNRPSNNAMDLQCCKELQIFEDISRLSLSDNKKHCETNEVSENEDKATLTHHTFDWWEAEIVVRGFKEKPIKGLNMWSS